jgi:ATP-dependent RNA helicase HelY
VLSALVFESRNPDDAEAPRVPGGRVRTVLSEMVSIWADLDGLERQHRVSFLREPDLGFAWAAYRWAGGADLEDVLEDVDLAPGDFVRWVKQLLDLAEQIADAAGSSPLRRTAREAVVSMRRGVVAYSAEVDDPASLG